jgi:ABC-type phosphate transport system substrate-binding protein
MKKILILLLLCFVVANSKAQVAVIANKSVPLESISETKLLDIYSGEIKWWDNGDPVVVFDLAEKTEVKSEFYNFIGKSTSRMKSIWLKKMLSGEGEPPEALKSEDEMLKFVVETIGAIGFISINKVVPEVKVLALVE